MARASRLWDAATGALLYTLAGYSGVTSVAFSGDGARIASSFVDWTVRLWDAATGVLLHTLVVHGSEVSSVALSGDGARIASGSYDLHLTAVGCGHMGAVAHPGRA